MYYLNIKYTLQKAQTVFQKPVEGLHQLVVVHAKFVLSIKVGVAKHSYNGIHCYTMIINMTNFDI